MNTTDTDALRERFAEALHYGQGYDDWGVANDDERGEALALADEVLPIVAEEVRKAKAEAWADCVFEASALGWLFPGPARHMLDRNPHRIETGDSDEHR